MKVLIVNILKDTILKSSFDRKMNYISEKFRFEKDIKYIENLNEIFFEEYSHLIISGSEACVLEWEPWYSQLEIIIRNFTKTRTPILGICFGHQFIAQMFCGTSAVVNAKKPEFGWTDIKFEKDDLFKDIRNLKSLCLHFDEVNYLDENFRIIASSDKCNIHAFKVIDKPIWGVQFHPDFMFEDTFMILERAKLNSSLKENYLLEMDISKEEYEENIKIFKNFISN